MIYFLIILKTLKINFDEKKCCEKKSLLKIMNATHENLKKILYTNARKFHELYEMIAMNFEINETEYGVEGRMVGIYTLTD